MKVLVLDCGSSSVKFQLVETDEATALAGSDRAVLVVPTSEELLIARDTFRIVRGLPLG
jgi:acetate kinase